MAPTFENIDLGDRANSFDALMALGKKANIATEGLIQQAIAMSPDVDDDYRSTLKSAAQNVQYYVASAISTKDADGKPMHLPNVAPYWTTH